MSNGVNTERTFFSLRYTIPGYTFLLILILVTMPKLLVLFTASLSTDLIGMFLGFLLSGPPVGFLVSQIWYVLFKSDCLMKSGFWRTLCLSKGMDVQKERREFLRSKYNLKEQYHQELTFSDYLHTLLGKTGDPWRDYTERRFNLMHILGSSFFSAIFSTVVGYITILAIFAIDGVTLPIIFYEIGLLAFIIVTLIFLLHSLRNIHLEHALASQVSIKKAVNDNLLSIEEARRIFHGDYFTRE